MSVDNTPSVGLNFGYITGESGWGDGVNANWMLLDAVAVPFAKSATLATPPSAPTDGDRYLIPAGADGVWTGRDGKLATWFKNQWVYFTPRTGWYQRAWDTRTTYVYDGAAWVEYLDTITPETMNLLNAAIAAAVQVETDAATVAADKAVTHEDALAAQLARVEAEAAAEVSGEQRELAQTAAGIATTARNDASASKDAAAASAQTASYAAASANSSAGVAAGHASTATTAAGTATTKAAEAAASAAAAAADAATLADIGTSAGADRVGFSYGFSYAAGTIGKWLKDLATSAGASFIGFIQSGTGAIATTLQVWLRRKVWADDYDTLQHALDTGKLVRLIEGATYPITGQLTVPTGGGIIGRGIFTINSTDFPATSKAISTQSVVINCLSVDRVTLRDFRMVVTAAQNSHIYPIAIRDVRKADVRGLDISGLNGGSMVLIDSSFDVSVINNDFHDSTIDRSASSGQLTGVEVDDFRISGVGSERINISHNRIKNLGWTSEFLTAYGPQTDGVNIKAGTKNYTVSHNIMDGVGEGVDTFGEDGEIIGNIIKGALGYGVKLIHGASRNLVTLNRIINSGLGGIVVAGSDSVSQNTDKNTIVNNVISGAGTNTGSYWAQPMYGIGINNDGATYKATNTTVRNNRVINSSGANFAFQGATAGAGNTFIDNESDGTAAAEYGGGTYTVFKRDYLGEFLSGVARLFGATPRLIVSENGAASNEKLWDTVYSGGRMTRRTRTDADGTGADFEAVDRTGTTVDQINWNASQMKFGGVDNPVRYLYIDSQGRIIQRIDNASGALIYTQQNYGITAVNNGFEKSTFFGSGGVQIGEAAREAIYATDTWADSAHASARYILKLIVAGVVKDAWFVDPSIDAADLFNCNLRISTLGKGLRVKEGSNAKQGEVTLVAGSVTVSNTSVTSNSRIFLTSQTDGGTPGFLRVTNRTPGTSFVITSSSGTDTSTVAYEIFEPS
jgi:hypothetical protein